MLLQDIPSLRLANLQITHTKYKKPEELVSFLGAVQSQDFFGAKWALGLRLPGSTDLEIEKAFNEGKILRTHVLRPTWHFVAPNDIRWMVELSKPQIRRMMKYYDKQLELDDNLYKKTYSVFEKTLVGKKALTREELGAELEKNKINAKGQRLAHIVFYSEIEGLICSGPRKGKQFTYSLIDEIAPKVKDISRDEALAKLAQLFFSSRGPATIKDFSKWSCLSQADCKKGLNLVKSRFQNEVIEGKEYWFEEKLSAISHQQSALLLPNYDEYISSYSDYTIISNKKTRKNLDKIGNAVFWNHMILDGNIVGSWKRTFKPKEIEVKLAPLVKLSNTESAAFLKVAEDFAKFYKLNLTLR